jgi:glyoxylase-like metal-dependent hydrolase (beta-lactamase superfamily II)
VKIRVLGCHGSEQLIEQSSGFHQCRTCGFLINDCVMVDAGTIGAALTLSEQKRIRQILLTHLHFDHIKGLPTFADNLAEAGEPVAVTCTADVLEWLRAHIFNGAVYPDFFKLPSPQRPVFTCRPVEAQMPSDICGLQVTAVRVNHSVPAVGFVIRDGSAAFLYSGDTFETDELWATARREPMLKAAFIETSFPDELADVAVASRHLTPALLAREFHKIGRPDVPLYVYHLKPRWRDVIERQLAQLNIRNVAVLREEQELDL